jgi:enoyl-CoA hydratase/carnithine racemase
MTAASSPYLIVEREGPILVLTFNRPDKLNALNREMQEALEANFRAAGEDPSVRVIVVTGTGRGFCAGADMEALQEGAEGSSDPDAVHIPDFTARQCKIYKPTICAVNGVCAGAGLHFVADSDIVIASEAASFTDTHVDVGQVTALEPIGLLQRMPMGAVLRMVVLGKAERLSAAQALETQMVSEVVPADHLRERAMELARISAKVSPASVQASLKAVWESLELPLSKAYDNGFDLLIRHRAHPDALEGPMAFIEKRDPVWSDGEG